MLTLLALALSGQLAVSSPPRSVDQTPVVSVRDRLLQICSDGLIQADLTPSTSAGSTLSTLRFDGAQTPDGQVRKYMLLDRRDQNNCPLPISYAVPDQPRALGRVIGEHSPQASAPQNR